MTQAGKNLRNAYERKARKYKEEAKRMRIMASGKAHSPALRHEFEEAAKLSEELAESCLQIARLATQL